MAIQLISGYWTKMLPHVQKIEKRRAFKGLPVKEPMLMLRGEVKPRVSWRI